MKRRGSATFETAVSYGVLVVLGVAVLFPFYWMIVTSFKNENQMRTIVSMFWPRPFAVENYQQLLARPNSPPGTAIVCSSRSRALSWPRGWGPSEPTPWRG
jgi:ABC-type glycerol-3-phosphate transport system permease component